MFLIRFIYLMIVIFKQTLIGLGPDVYLDTINGTTICAIFGNADIIVMSSFGRPASMSFRFDKACVAEKPNCKNTEFKIF